MGVGNLAYDSAWVWCIALDHYLRAGHSLPDLLTYDNATAAGFLFHEINALDFYSVSGRILFNEDQDRVLPVGIDITSDNIRKRPLIYSMGNVTEESPPIWPDGSQGVSNAPVSDVSKRFSLDPYTQIAMFVLTAAVVISLLLVHYVIYVNRTHKVIKAASLKFSYIIIYGSLLTCASALLYMIQNGRETDAMCIARTYTPQLGTSLLFLCPSGCLCLTSAWLLRSGVFVCITQIC